MSHFSGKSASYRPGNTVYYVVVSFSAYDIANENMELTLLKMTRCDFPSHRTHVNRL